MLNPRPTPLLFLHGAWHGAWCWDEHFLPYFAGHGYASYALSLRGHGRSSGAAGLRRYRIKDYVQDLKGVIAQMPAPPVVVGHSLGGHVVQKYAERQALPGIVLMASVPVGGIVKMLERLAHVHPIQLLKVNCFLSLYPFVATPQMAKEMLFSNSMPMREVLPYAKLLRDESYFSFLDMLLLSPIKPRNVKSPVLILGAHDDNVFYRRDIRKTARAYKEKAIILPGMPHDMMLDRNWQVAADTILRWLAERQL